LTIHLAYQREAKAMYVQVQPGRFKLAWLAAGFAVVPLTVALTIAALLAAGAVISAFQYATMAEGLVLVLALFWLLNGACIGFLQKAIVKRFLSVDLGPWTAYSVLGALLAGIIAYPCLDGACLPDRFYEFPLSTDAVVSIEISTDVLIYLTVFSAAQSLGLQRRVLGSWRWIAAHLGANVLAIMSALALMLAVPSLAHLNMLLSLGLIALFVTISTGIVMQRMLKSNIDATVLVHDEWAYQPVAIDP